MNKNLSKILMFVSAILLTSPLLGCNKNKNNNNTREDTANHDFSNKDTDKDLIRGGVTEYKVVVPAASKSELTTATDELSRFFEEATGIKLDIVTDAGKSHSNAQKYISLGDTSLLKSTELYSTNLNLKKDGARIVTKDNNIYIFGETSTSVLYGVYDFLNLYFNFEYYFTDAYTLTKGVKDLKLKDFNVTDIPDIEYRQRRGLFYPTTGNPDDMMFGYRSRCVDDMSSLLLPIYQGSEAKNVHNSFFFIPKTQSNLRDHPEFFATSGEQLCYTARGNKEAFDLMVETCAAKVEESLIKHKNNKNYDHVGVFTEDNVMLCQCDACNKCYKEHNNAKVAPVIIFVKAMGKKVNEWMARPENAEYARDLSYMFFAYQEFLTPPFEDLDHVKPDVALEPGIKMMPYVALSEFNTSKSIYDKINDNQRHNAELWGAYYEGAWAWSYGGFFQDYMAFQDCYSFYADYNKFLKENKYAITFNQVQDYQRGGHSGFFNMASYCLAKMSWNSSLDIFELTENYIKNVFKEASVPMRKLFEEFRLLYAKWVLNYNVSSGSMMITTQSKFFSNGILRQFLALLDEAYEAIEIYQEMPEEYERLKKYIDFEWLFVGKVIIDCSNTLHGFTNQEVNDAKAKFREIVEKYGVRAHREFVSISEYLNSIA